VDREVAVGRPRDPRRGRDRHGRRARLVDDLRALTEDATFEVAPITGSFRRVAG
jgi:hypothetical protein